jgi:phosphatidate cytidylyltransferase
VKRVLTAAILIPIVIVALFRAPLWLFTLLVLGVALLAAREYFGIVKAQGFRPFTALGYLFVAVSLAVLYMFTSFQTAQPTELGRKTALIYGYAYFWGVPAIAFLPPLVLLVGGLRREPLSKALPDAATSYMVLPYVAFTLGTLVLLRSFRDGALYVLYVMLLVWCGDVAAYYVGRAIGRHKLAPRVSPGKSWEGALASVLGAIVVGLMLFRFINPIASGLEQLGLFSPAPHAIIWPPPSYPWSFPPPPLWLIALFATSVNVAAQVGDLVESALKRGAGVKDSGTLLPGHGGVLDRIDALLFALPVGLIFHALGMSTYFQRSVNR